jgi:hypothetical protein
MCFVCFLFHDVDIEYLNIYNLFNSSSPEPSEVNIWFIPKKFHKANQVYVRSAVVSHRELREHESLYCYRLLQAFHYVIFLAQVI